MMGVMHGRGCVVGGGMCCGIVCMAGEMRDRGHAWQGGMHGGECIAWGASVAGVCGWQGRRPLAVDSMHPTGMHSC